MITQTNKMTARQFASEVEAIIFKIALESEKPFRKPILTFEELEKRLHNVGIRGFKTEEIVEVVIKLIRETDQKKIGLSLGAHSGNFVVIVDPKLIEEAGK